MRYFDSPKKILLLTLVLLAVPLSLYLLTMPLTNVGYADSDELLTVAFNGGVAHPPGYPLYTLLLSAFTHLPLVGTVAFKGHLLSVVLSTITLLFVFATSFRLLHLVNPSAKSKGLILLASIAGTLSLAFTALYWQYSIITEKHALSILLVSIASFFLAKLQAQKVSHKPIPSSHLYASAIILGISFAHHPLLGLLVIPYAYILFIKTKFSVVKSIKLAGIALLAALISSALIFVTLLTKPVVSWQFDPTVQGWWNMVSRSEFFGNVYQHGFYSNLIGTGLDFNRSFVAITNYSKLLLIHGGAPYVLSIVFLLLFLTSSKNRSIMFPMILNFFLLGVGVAGFLNWPSDWGSQGITLRQYLPGLITLAPLLSVGFFWLIVRLKSGLQVLTKKTLAPLAIALGVVILALVSQIFLVYPHINFKNFTLVSARYSNIIDSVRPNAIITCYSDTSCFALLYERFVNYKRPDVTIVPLAYPLVPWVFNDPGLHPFAYQDNPFMLFDLITTNLDKRPVYAVEISDFYYSFLGINDNYMYYIPYGPYGELTRNFPQTLPVASSPLTHEWLQSSTSVYDPYRIFLKTTAARDHLLNGSLYIKYGFRDLSLPEFNAASDIFHQFSALEEQQITGLRTNLEQQAEDYRVEPGKRVDSSSTWLAYVEPLVSNNQLGKAFRAALGAVASDPFNIEARLALADLYRLQGEVNFARIEYTNALHINPENASASAALEELSLL